MRKIPRTSKLWMRNAPDWIRNAYRLRLEVEYRKSHGSDFQRLFDRIMRSIHGDKYVATAAMGSEGDLGCDGILRSNSLIFAIYGPDPYFRLNGARSKMRSDFARLLDCWKIPDEAKAWTFVINYPRTPPSLLKVAKELQQLNPDVDVNVWSREDLTRQFLLCSNRTLADNEFGKVGTGAKTLAPLSLVPEDTALPSEQAQLLHRKLWARLTCNKVEFEKAERKWLHDLTVHTWENFLTHTQFLIGSIACAVMANAFDVGAVSIKSLQRECGLSGKESRKDILHAWSCAVNIIFKEDSPYGLPEWPDNEDESIVKMATTCITQERLILAMIRKHARRLRKWETDVLDETWTWAAHEIKMRKD